MSFFEPNMLTSLSSSFDERQWIKHMRQTLDEELEEGSTRIPITIFSVPKPLMICSPDSYIPQVVAIGQYHHFRPEVFDMERYKVAAARRSQKELQNIRLQDVVDHLIKFEHRIRAIYHRPLNLGPEALAWVMAVDTCFLLEFFQVCGVKKGKVLTKTPSRLEHLINLSGNKTAHNAILRDIVMLENQIPLFVMRMLLEFQFSSLDLADEWLVDMLIEFINEISPFKTVAVPQKIVVQECAHLLDILYCFVVPKVEALSEIIEIDEEEGNENKGDEENNKFSEPNNLRQLVGDVWEQHSNSTSGPVAWIKKIFFSKPTQVILKLPWTILSRIPIVNMVKGPIENMLASVFQKDKEKKDNEEPGPNSSNNINKPPLLNEIRIPSVTELTRIGVQFVHTNEGIASIAFDEKTLTFSIPVVELDINSEVVLRNLVAYEACSASGPLVLTRFTELMNGIIDTEEDAKVLCQRGIVINRLKSEKEVAELWNGMSRSIRLTKVPCFDRVIADVNKYYKGRWKVKFEKFMKRYVFGSWRILTFLAAIVMMLLICLQAFCQVYSCSNFFPIQVSEAMNP